MWLVFVGFIFIFLFVVGIFIGFWYLISFILARGGWNKLAEKYKYDEDFDGKRLGSISCTINNTTYKNSVIMRIGKEGIYLKMFIFFRFAHPPILIPWNDIKDIAEKSERSQEIIVGDPQIASIYVTNRLHGKIEDALVAIKEGR